MDALAAIVSLLRPQTVLSKTVSGGGRWGIRYPAFGHPSFALALTGSCWMAADGAEPFALEAGDFILSPRTPGFTLASGPDIDPSELVIGVTDRHIDAVVLGDPTEDPSASLLGGYFLFDPVNASLLVRLLPSMLLVRSTDAAMASLAPIVALIRRETSEERPGQALVLTRLAEILLVEALRSAPMERQAPGLLAGLRDPQLAATLRAIHARTAEPWTLVTLAREASMSRSSFAERFSRVIGVTPLNYLLQWRMAVAKDLLVRDRLSVSETAYAVGYQSASGFSTAFSREVGRAPVEYVAAHRHDMASVREGAALGSPRLFTG